MRVRNWMLCGELPEGPGLRHGVYVYKGTLTNEIIGEAFHIPYKSIELLISVNPY